MPLTLLGANDGLDSILMGVTEIWVHMHTAFPTRTNAVSGPAAGPVRTPISAWRRRSRNGFLELYCTVNIDMPTPGGDWSDWHNTGLWTKESLADNPADQPELLHGEDNENVIMARENDSIRIPAGGIVIPVPYVSTGQ